MRQADLLARAAAAGLACLLAGCALGPAGRRGDPPVRLTEPVTPSAFVAVVPAAMSGTTTALSRIVAETARPGEDVEILRAGARPSVLVAAQSPPPATVVVPGRPAAPQGGTTDYQRATYASRLKRWHGEVAAGRREVTARTGAAMSAWASGLGIGKKVSGVTPAGTDPTGLAEECSDAVSALAGLEQMAGGSFGVRRVIMAYATSLGGIPPTGELTGDDVIVVTSFLPSAAAASEAQAGLLRAGAAWASVLGPEATPAQLARLVSAGLSQAAPRETVSGSVLFANGRSALPPGAEGVLSPLLGPLRSPGAIAVIGGYASTPGSIETNYRLSYARATSVANFFESHGIPASSLVIVGHGADDLIAPGPSAANRRVTVVIEETPGGAA
jgi:outer membrane protein OmpA-like peptidoglycan-associated protein